MPDTDHRRSREEKATLPAGREPTLRVVPMPSDANYTGDIFGGWIMSQVDIAGSIPAIELARGGWRRSPSTPSCSSNR